ncbi:L-lysine permease [Candidatus Paraburkholderia calva]|nr:L-lysine permease [Candidatus Paraburkholderia calva]
MPNFLLFLAASVAITLAPGADNLQVLARGISQGRLAGVVAACGFAFGVIFHTTLAALDIAALLCSSPLAFQAVKLEGAAYLVWIGIKALRSHGLATAHERTSQPLSTVFGQSVMLQMFELGGVFMLQTVVVFSAFGIGAGMIGAWLKRRPRVGVWLDRLAGATFIALGIRVALRD